MDRQTQVSDRLARLRRRMERSRAALAHKLHALGQRAHGAAETVESVTDVVNDTVDAVQTVRETLSVKRHPLLMMAGAVLAGCLVGVLGSRRRAPTPEGPSTPAPAPAPEAASGNGKAHAGLIEGLLHQAERWGLGATLGLARDLLVQQVPDEAKPTAFDLANSLTTQLGGEPFGPLLLDPSEIQKGKENEHDDEMGGPLGPGRRQGQETVGGAHRR